MTRLPTLGPRGEGWVAIQGILLLAIAAAGALGPAWEGVPARVTVAIGVIFIGSGPRPRDRGHRATCAGRSRRSPTRAPDAELVETGVYGLVRHPIYGGLVVRAVGWGLRHGVPVAALVGAVLLLGFFELKSRREEAWLERRFAGYAAYRARTRRLIPWIG